jgi:hypothetical protein
MRTLDQIKLWLKVNIYNPFTPHIVFSRAWDCYCVRKFEWLLGWTFMSNDSDSWWSGEEYAKKYCKIDTLDIAKTKLLRYNEKKRLEKQGFVHVPIKD